MIEKLETMTDALKKSEQGKINPISLQKFSFLDVVTCRKQRKTYLSLEQTAGIP